MADMEVVMAGAKFSDEDDEQIRWVAKEVITAKYAHAASGMEIGRLLCGARARCQGYGKTVFPKFLAEVDVAATTAYRYMAVYEKFGALKEKEVEQISISAMEELTKKATPDQAVERVVKQIKCGALISIAKAKQIVAEVKDEQKPKPPKPERKPEPWEEGSDESLAAGGGGEVSGESESESEGEDFPELGKSDDTQEGGQSDDSGGTADDESGTQEGEERPKPPPRPAVYDRAGHRIDRFPSIIADFDESNAMFTLFEDTLLKATLLADRIEKHRVGKMMTSQNMSERLELMRKFSMQMRPFSLCPGCHGQTCQECNGRGWVALLSYENGYSEEAKLKLKEASDKLPSEEYQQMGA